MDLPGALLVPHHDQQLAGWLAGSVAGLGTARHGFTAVGGAIAAMRMDHRLSVCRVGWLCVCLLSWLSCSGEEYFKEVDQRSQDDPGSLVVNPLKGTDEAEARSGRTRPLSQQ